MQDVMVWDLSDLYSGIDDPQLEETLARQLERAQRFEERYRGQIEGPDLTAALLREAIEEYESIQQERDKPLLFAWLMFAANTNEPARGAFLQQMQERSTEIALYLLFFDLELRRVDEARLRPLLDTPILAPYRHYIEVTRKFRDHQLPEPEEKILQEKASTGPAAFRQLFEEVVSNSAFRVERDGGVERLTHSEVLARLSEPDREARRTAAAALSRGLQEHQCVLTFVFNTLLQDKHVENRLRHYHYPEEERHLANELSRETVELMARTVEEHYPLVARYYRIKREILGLEEMTHYDIWAPLFAAKEEISFDRARTLVLDAFGAFSPVLEHAATEFFEKRWIDAAPRAGKRVGAFCEFTTPDLHPFVGLSYLNQTEDVLTLAHELGHGVHASLSRSQSYLNFLSTVALAELASIFGEMLVFERLQVEAGLAERLVQYAEKIQSAFAMIFRRVALHRFEQTIHRRRREQGELRPEEYGDVWQAQMEAMFGDSIRLGEEHRYWWLQMSDLMSAPFYSYAYAFSELLVLALYRRYKTEGQDFAPGYVELLRAGGSMSPEVLMSRIGLNLDDPDLWRSGLDVLEGMVAEFERLYQQYKLADT